jgi:hypothetical protein
VAVRVREELRWRIFVALGLALLTTALMASWPGTPWAGGETLAERGEDPRVACWNRYFPFEPGGPVFRTAPGKCAWYRRKAETYAEGALLGRKLRWTWGDQRAVAIGRVKVPGIGRDFGPGRVRLLEPVQSCGRTVFSSLKYSMRDSEGRLTGGYPIYTCRSNYD